MNYNKFSSRDYILFRDSSSVFPDSALPEATFITKTKVKKKSLINKLNFVHFNDDTILLKFKHKKYGNEISLKAKPQPCTGNLLECLWLPDPGLHQKLQSYKFTHCLLSDGLKLIRIEATVLEIDDQGITLELPDFCYELSLRKLKRHPSTGIEVKLIQKGVVFHGRLVDFNTLTFKVEIVTTPPQTFEWIHPDQSALIILKDKNIVYYSGEINIIRHSTKQDKRIYVLEIVEKAINRFRKKEFRSTRHRLKPSPNIFFTHPLTKKMATLPVYDISGSGFSVEENIEQSVLLPGLVIPDMEIEIADSYSLKCISQVMHREKTGDQNNDVVQSGLAILDMNIQDQMKLGGILHRSNNKNTYVCNRVDIDNLWEFFFDAGFIYPEKYQELYHNKEKFKKTYEKLYIEHPQIARHFIYQDKGIIYGHMSMLRFFSKTWLYHHHASNHSTYKGPGIKVLNQIVQYTNDFYQQYSTNMSYIVCYYQSKNRLPRHIFGNFAKKLKDANGCCVYPMSYSIFNVNNNKIEMPSNISIEPAEFEDLVELKNCIGEEYGKLLFCAFDFKSNLYNKDELSTEFEKIGLKREKYIFSVRIYGKLKAIFLILVSDLGINLSELTNSVYIFVIDQQHFTKNDFSIALYEMQKHYNDRKIKVLIYPASYAKNNNIVQDKVYNLWVFNTAYLDNFIKFTNKYLK